MVMGIRITETIFGSWNLFKNDEKCYYFTSKAPFVLKIFKFLLCLFGHVAKRLDETDKVSFKI